MDVLNALWWLIVLGIAAAAIGVIRGGRGPP